VAATEVTAADAVALSLDERAGPSGLAAVGLRLLRNRKGAFGRAALLPLLVVATLAPQIAPYDPHEVHLPDNLGSP